MVAGQFFVFVNLTAQKNRDLSSKPAISQERLAFLL